jgi:radical SAM protein with 4Fe4S-binding SPASM domain
MAFAVNTSGRNGGYQPSRFVLQWHVTERCNYRCTHCYQETYDDNDLPLERLLLIIDQLTDFVSRWQMKHGRTPFQAHVNLTGGEPLLRPDFQDLLAALARRVTLFTFGILCNGSLIDRPMARYLRKMGAAYVQVSIEGTRARNDEIRGPRAHDLAVSAVKHLREAGIRTQISFTAHRGNFRDFLEVARVARGCQASMVWADRLIPWGVGTDLTDQLLTTAETREFFEVMHQARRECAEQFSRTEIAMARALQFLVGGGAPYHCGAGDTIVCVQPNGDLYPCRRMPIRVGNLFQTPLAELYEESVLFWALRDRSRTPAACASCRFRESCGGGLRCLSYAVTGDPFAADPGCWRAAPAAIGCQESSAVTSAQHPPRCSSSGEVT